MSEITVRKNEPFENSLRKFKKQCERDGILSDVKQREYYDKPSVKRKKKSIAAKKKMVKQNRKSR